MPAQDLHDALAVEQVEAKPLGFAPLVAPAGPSSPVACLSWTASSSALRTRRDIGPINPQHQHGTAKTARRDLVHTPRNLLARGCHLHHAEALGRLAGERVHALTTHGNATELPEQP